MLQRKRYIERVRPLYDNDSIKLITGIRQTGKSVLMRQIRDELEAQGKKIIYIDFADLAIAEECRDVKSISSYIAVHWRRRGILPGTAPRCAFVLLFTKNFATTPPR